MPRIGGCSVCKRENLRVKVNRLTGLLWCCTCADQSRKKEKCVRCGKIRRIAARKKNGGPHCASCTNAETQFQCGICKEKKRGYPNARRKDGAPICVPCAELKLFFQCGVCEQEKRGYPKKRHEGKAICNLCAGLQQDFQCSVCDENKRGYPNVRRRDGKPICRSCTGATLSL